MKWAVRHCALGISTGVTVFAIVVPLIHLLVELAASAGVQFGPWDNPIEVFIFLMTAAMVGVFPWGLWIVLTDARNGNMFDKGHEVAEYLLAAIGVFLSLTLLVCTLLQPVYAQFRWFCTPVLAVCGAALIYWRWTNVWEFPSGIGVRRILDYALALHSGSKDTPPR